MIIVITVLIIIRGMTIKKLLQVIVTIKAISVNYVFIVFVLPLTKIVNKLWTIIIIMASFIVVLSSTIQFDTCLSSSLYLSQLIIDMK